MRAALACEDRPAASTHSVVTEDAGVDGSALDRADGGVRVPELAPLCEADSVPFIPVIVTDRQPYSPAAQQGTTARVQIAARGLGLPPEVPDIHGASSDDVGWLRVVELPLLEPSGADAGAPSADAGAAASRGAEGTTEAVSHVVVGPRALAELPVALGAELELSLREFSSPLYGSVYAVVLEQADRVLLLHQVASGGATGTVSGFTLSMGATVCGLPYQGDCADDYRHALEVSVPGGASATLAPGQTQTVGSYRVFHGASGSVTRLAASSSGENACPADAHDHGYSQLTALLLPDARRDRAPILSAARAHPSM